MLYAKDTVYILTVAPEKQSEMSNFCLKKSSIRYNWEVSYFKSSKGCYLVVGQTSNTNDIEQYFMKWRDANMYCNGLWSGATLGIFPNPFYNWFIASQVRKMVSSDWLFEAVF